MTGRIPAGCDGLIPHLVCRRCGDAIDFYVRAFDAKEVGRMPGPDGRIMHAFLQVDGRPLYLVDDFPEFSDGKSSSPESLGGTPVTIHRYVEDVDAAMKQAIEAGATVRMPAQDMFWGDRYGVLTDPFGHSWSLATHISDLTPEDMQKAMESMHAPE